MPVPTEPGRAPGERARSVLVVDPYPLVQDALERLVDAHPWLELTGPAADVAVVGDENGIAALAARMPVLALLDDASPEAAVRALRGGAAGVVSRGAEPARVVRALEAVAFGALVAGPSVAELLVRPRDAVRTRFPELTPRERDVLVELAHGATNGQIARALGLSAKTVRNHMSSVCTKLRVLDRAQAAIVAREAGLAQRA